MKWILPGTFALLAASCGLNSVCDPQTGQCDATSADAGAVTGLPCDVAGLFGAYCASCHGSPPQAAPMSLTSRAQLLVMAGTVTEAQRCLIRMTDASAPMPPTGLLSAGEVTVLQSWISAGYPGGSCTTISSTGSGNGSSGGGAGGGSGTGGGGGAAASYCASCAGQGQCGDPNNFCLSFSFGNYCGTDCSQGQACPASSRCATITDNTGTAVGQNCVPVSGATCSSAGTGGGSGGGGGSNATCTDTWSSFGQAFFSQNCSQCHGQFSSQSGVQASEAAIASRISGGSMPPSGLSASARSEVLSYLSCGVK